MLGKGVYPYEYIDYFEKNIETSLLRKKKTYGNLNTLKIDGIIVKDFEHVKKVWKQFRIKISHE